MKLHYPLWLCLTLLLAGAYAPPATFSEAFTSEMMADFWINPPIACTLNTGERPIKRYPVDKGKKSDKKDDPEGFANFCSRMEVRFASSGITLPDADTVYTAILNGKFIKDGSYGMPHPDASPTPDFTLADIKQRVKIKKTANGEYEIFYKYTGCGTNYSHEAIETRGEKLIKRRKIEAWKGSFPC